MNLIQKEMLLKAARLGCTVEAADANLPLEVKKDGYGYISDYINTKIIIIEIFVILVS